MALHELHPFTGSEIDKLTGKRGVYILFQIETPVHADGAANLRHALRSAKAEFPQATHFSVEVRSTNGRSLQQKIRKLRKELHRVRAMGFVGSRR